MGPVGAAMGAMRRADNAMINRARSIFKRRPNLKHKDNGPLRPVKRFKARKRNAYRSAYAQPPRSKTLLPILISTVGISLGIIIVFVVVRANWNHPAFTRGYRDDPVSSIICAVVVGTSIFAASLTALLATLCSKRARRANSLS